MTVERRIPVNQGVDIRDRHQDPDGVALRLRHRELVEISRVVVVDRRPWEVAKIPGARVRRRRPGDGVGLRHGLRGKVGQQAAFLHHATRDAPQARTVGGGRLIHSQIIPGISRQTARRLLDGRCIG
jgi:hypothetical protein